MKGRALLLFDFYVYGEAGPSAIYRIYLEMEGFFPYCESRTPPIPFWVLLRSFL